MNWNDQKPFPQSQFYLFHFLPLFLAQKKICSNVISTNDQDISNAKYAT